MPIWIRGGTLLDVINGTFTDGDVLIGADGKIAALGTFAAPESAIVLEAHGCAVLHGLVNAHTHLSQTFMRGLGDDKKLLDWLKGVVWKLQAAMTPEDVYLATLLGLVENVTCGVVALTEHHKLVNSPAHSDAALRAYLEFGLPTLFAYGWNDLGDGALQLDQIIAEMERLRATAHGSNVQVCVGPMVPWRCSDEAMQRTFALAEAWQVPFHLHAAETQDEVGLMIARNGMRHIEWLARLGVLSARTQVVHGVWLSDDEMRLLQKSGARLIHCPTSNMYLASGMAKIAPLFGRGVPIALGADGSGSNNSQDMLELLKIAALLAKIETMDATALLPRHILYMACVEGAAAVGLSSAALSLGNVARLICVDIQTPRSAPVHDPFSALVYTANGADVRHVIVGNRIFVRERAVQGVDVAALIAECTQAAKALLRRAELL
ncbi:MAG: amidohydrolase [Candidatus Thermofonsia Clade 1 bacterium]|uniref:Amidohydrolase n=1 Tax=Candidatus Thermofonsia Clade 1 bacterium TaxID=2364210 RepID=A0A2M8PD09_9CHLR|nr:MAG: amidohydrolase [Candidatus Thermofonsia Clade 1 bacterium]